MLFADEQVCEEALDQLEHMAEVISPTLDMNDNTTLTQSISNMKQRYDKLKDLAKKNQDKLDDSANKWQTFQVRPWFYNLHVLNNTSYSFLFK